MSVEVVSPRPLQGGAGAAGGNGGAGGDALGLLLPFEYNVIEDAGALTKQLSLLDLLGGGRAGNGGNGGSGGDGLGSDQGFDGGKAYKTKVQFRFV